MSPKDSERGGGGAEGRTTDQEIKRVPSRWLKATLASNRIEFEREMQRSRRGFAHELERFWKEHRPTS